MGVAAEERFWVNPCGCGGVSEKQFVDCYSLTHATPEDSRLVVTVGLIMSVTANKRLRRTLKTIAAFLGMRVFRVDTHLVQGVTQ